MSVIRRFERLGHSARIVGLGLLLTTLVAVGVTIVTTNAIGTTEDEVERLSETSESRGFAIRHIERVETLGAELEMAVASWMLEPDDSRNALRVERLASSFDEQTRRLAEILPADRRQHWVAMRAPLRDVRATLSQIRIKGRSSADGEMPSDMHEQLDAPLERLRAALDAAEAELRADRAVELERLHTDLRQASRASAIAGVVFIGIVGAVWLLILRALLSKERQLDEAVEKMIQANEELDAFAGRTAHELRNVLSPASMAVQYLERASTSRSDDPRILERLQRSFKRASEVIEALLTFSRSGRPTKGPTSVDRVVADVVDTLRPRADELGVRLRGRAETVQVACDEGLVHAVVSNLVGNSIKFSEGSPDASVEVEAVRDGSYVELRVSDTGPGIPDQDRERVFEPFYRAGNTDKAGSGIGLATVARIAKSHGGRVRIDEPASHRGARVRVWLPMHDLGTRHAGPEPAAAKRRVSWRQAKDTAHRGSTPDTARHG